MIIVITHKNGEIEKVKSDRLMIVGGSAAYIGEEKRQIKLDQITYIEVVENGL